MPPDAQPGASHRPGMTPEGAKARPIYAASRGDLKPPQFTPILLIDRVADPPAG